MSVDQIVSDYMRDRERLTREEFRQWAKEQTERYERVGGVPIAMPPENFMHIVLKTEVREQFDRAIRAAALEWECEAVSGIVEVDDDTDYRPSAVVNLGPRLDPEASVAPCPVIVAEVLSPTGQEIDSADKLADYFRVASIQHYLIVRMKKHEVIHHTRSGDKIITRTVSSGAIELNPPGIVIDIAKIYQNADQDFETQRRFQEDQGGLPDAGDRCP